MTKLLVFSLALFLTCSVPVLAQYRLSGTVRGTDSTAVAGCTVYLNNGNRQAVTDSAGQFSFQGLTNGRYVLQTTHPDFKAASATTTIADQDRTIVIALNGRTETLNEVTVTDQQSDFGFTRMRGVESMGNY